MKTEHLQALRGSLCLQMTPFRNGRMDDDAYAYLCERQIGRGTAALVPLGQYSDAAALDRRDQARAIRLAVEVARGRVPVIAGGGVNYTTIAIDLAQQAERLGADALFCVVPYYDQTSQQGLFHHFQAIQGASSLPVIIYDVPSRNGLTLAQDTCLRLAGLPKVAGIADATGDVTRARALRQTLGPDFLVLCGDMRQSPAFRAAGAQGSVSVAANIAPALCAALHRAWAARASGCFQYLAAVLEVLDGALDLDAGPPALRWALASLGLIADERQPPMGSLAAGQEALLRLALDTVVPVEAALAGGDLDKSPPPLALLANGDGNPLAEEISLMMRKNQENPDNIKITNLISKAAFQTLKQATGIYRSGC